jgi:hypothetical protein
MSSTSDNFRALVATRVTPNEDKFDHNLTQPVFVAALPINDQSYTEIMVQLEHIEHAPPTIVFERHVNGWKMMVRRYDDQDGDHIVLHIPDDENADMRLWRDPGQVRMLHDSE